MIALIWFVLAVQTSPCAPSRDWAEDEEVKASAPLVAMGIIAGVCFVIALDRAGTDRPADRHDLTVIGERRTAPKPHGLGRRIDRRREA
jgi:hypothetical protein